MGLRRLERGMERAAESKPQLSPGQVSPYALMAAILFHVGSTEKICAKDAETGEDIEAEVCPVGIEREKGALVCVVDVEKIIHFCTNHYDYKLRYENGHAVISFEKRSPERTVLLDASGKQADLGHSKTIQALLDRMS